MTLRMKNISQMVTAATRTFSCFMAVSQLRLLFKVTFVTLFKWQKRKSLKMNLSDPTAF